MHNTYPATQGHIIDQGFQVTKLVFFETGTYNDVVVRPYISNVNHQTQALFHDVTHNGQLTTTNSLGLIAGQLLRPQAQYDGTLSIANGWGTRRFSFMMEVRGTGNFGRGLRFILMGYTDDVAVSLQSQHLDPNMMLYFNNSFTVKEVISRDSRGNIVSQHAKMADASHVMSPSLNEGLMVAGGLPPDLRTIRPEDSFSTMSRASYLNEYSNGGYEIQDDVGTLRQGITKNRRTNNHAAAYLSEALTAQRNSWVQHREDTMDEVVATAQTMVRDVPITLDSVLNALMGCTEIKYRGGITYGELVRFSPSAETVRHVVLRGPTQRVGREAGRHLRNETEQWTSPDQRTVMATVLVNSVTALMSSEALTYLVLTVTNRTIDGRYLINISNEPYQEPRSFVEGMDIVPNIQTFITRLEYEVLPGLTQNNQLPISFTMVVDLMTETRVDISIGDDLVEVPFVNPSFCDSMIAPILTADVKKMYAIANDLQQLQSI